MVPIKDALIDWKHYKLGKHLRNLENMRLIRTRMQPFIDALEYGRLMHGFEDRHWSYNSRRGNTYDHLVDWNELLIKKLAQTFRVGCQWRRASQIDQERAGRWVKPPGYPPIKDTANKLAAYCELVGAATYLTGPSWSSYAPNLKEVLKSHGIELKEI
jgi:hypothetical protein